VSSPVIVLTTLGGHTDGVAFGRALVTSGLAACVNVLPPMMSVYKWKGALEEDIEQQLLIKTTTDHVEALQAHFNRFHPYEVAEFLVVPVSEGSSAYLRWLVESLAPAPAPGPGDTERS
jgi:periplasmic divalent cation tolerance protein